MYSAPRSPSLLKVYLISFWLMNRCFNNSRKGSSSTMSIRLQKGMSNYAVSPHFPPIIKTVFSDFCGRIRLNFASSVSTTSLLSLCSEWSSMIKSDVPAEAGGKTKCYDISMWFGSMILNISYLLILHSNSRSNRKF